MKKHLFAFGTLLTTLALLGCSGTVEKQATMGSGQAEKTLNAEVKTGESTGKLSEPGSSSVSLASDAKTVRIGSIDWYVNYDDALANAKQTNRPVWLHFGENPG